MQKLKNTSFFQHNRQAWPTSLSPSASSWHETHPCVDIYRQTQMYNEMYTNILFYAIWKGTRANIATAMIRFNVSTFQLFQLFNVEGTKSNHRSPGWGSEHPRCPMPVTVCTCTSQFHTRLRFRESTVFNSDDCLHMHLASVHQA